MNAEIFIQLFGLEQMTRSNSVGIPKAWIVLFWISLACFLLIPASGSAEKANSLMQGLSSESFKSKTQEMWKIEAERISYDKKRKVYEAEGNVRITSEDRSIQANWARLYNETQEVRLRGDVLVRYGADWLKGEEVEWNLETETGRVDGGLVYLAENHFYVEGEHIAKIGPLQYKLHDGFITTCDPDRADWKVRYQELKIDADGITWAKHTSFWIGSIPVLYSPFVALPIQRNRQSGFLVPWGGYSDLNGLQGEVPFFWAIREDMDATFFGRYMEERGWMSGLEYRIANRTWGEGTWIFNYLHDQADKSHLADLGYPFETKGRYWIRSRHTVALPQEIEAHVDLDLVSDRNFLREFEDGSSSWSYSNDAFLKASGRGILDDETITARESDLYVNKRSDSTLLYLNATYWDQTDPALDEQTLQRLPALAFNVAPSWIGDRDFYYDVQSAFVNYWREEGDQGQRLDINPRVHYPFRWSGYLDLEPSVGLRATAYSVEWQDDSLSGWQGRFLPDVRLELTSRLNRVYPLNMGNFIAVQHAFRPELIYEYMPEVDQDELPDFDSSDKIEERHGISYGFTNFLTTKVNERDAKGNPVTSYRELARMRIFQTLNIRRSATNLRFGPDQEFLIRRGDEGEKRRFSNVNVLLDILPTRYVTLTYDAGFSPEDAGAAHHSLYSTLASGRGDFLRIGYQYWEDTPIDELIAESDIKILPNLYFNTYHDYSFDQKELFEQGYGVKYQHGCWGVRLVYEKEADDQRVALSVNLLGLGEVGGSYSYGAGDQ